MTVSELWRYPVKSLRGERLQVAEIDKDGVAGDRLVHVRQQSGRVVTSRFRPRLLGLQAALGEGTARSNVSDAVSALSNLGYSSAQASAAVAKVIAREGDKAETAVLIRLGLRELSN